MAQATRALLRRGLRTPAIVYNDCMIRGPSQLPSKVQRRAYEIHRWRIPVDDYGIESDVHMKTEPRIEKTSDTAQPEAIPIAKQAQALADTLTQRHRYPHYKQLTRLLDRGAVVEAMTLFKIAYSEWKLARLNTKDVVAATGEISPHVIDDLLIRLSRMSRSPRRNWDECPQSVWRSSYWSPQHLPAQYDIKQVHVCALSYHALLDVYDMGSSLGFLPSNVAMSAIILALSHASTESHFISGTTELLLRCSGTSFEDSQMLLMSSDIASLLENIDFARIPVEVICALVKGYGKIGKAHQGEVMLQRWAASFTSGKIQNSSIHQEILVAHWKSAKDRRDTKMEAPNPIESSAWAKHIEVWVSLIQSREATDDLAGARYWLERYRLEGLKHHKEYNFDECHQPHIAYLLACTRMRKGDIEQEGSEDQLEKDAWISGGMSRVEAVQEIVEIMHTDGTSIPVNVRVLLLNFYAGCNMREEAQIMKATLNQDSLSKDLLPRYYKGMFHLHCLFSTKECNKGRNSKAAQRGAKSPSKLRQDFITFLNLPPSWWRMWPNDLKRQILNYALRASLACRDYPLASRILRTFRDRQLLIDHHTEIAMMTSLEPDRLEAIRKEKRVQHHQRTIHINLIRILKETATEERPFEQFTVNSKPQDWKPIMNTPWHRLLRLIKYLDKYMVSLMQNGDHKVLTDWMKKAKKRLKGRKMTHRSIVDVLLAPFPERKMLSSPGRRAGRSISIKESSSESSRERAAAST